MLVGPGRVELPTSPLSGARSHQLSYEPTSKVEGEQPEFGETCPMEWDRIERFRDRPSKCDPLRKEVIQPQVLLRLPCYDLVPVTKLAFDVTLLVGWDHGFGHSRLPWLDGRCVQGSGTYSPRRS